MATMRLEQEFLEKFQTCCFCQQKMNILSNPQLTTCIHSVCFKCAADKRSYCCMCQQPVTVITDNSVLTTVIRIVSNGEPQAISPEESIDEYSKKQFGELAIQVDQAIKDIRDKLKLLKETKIKLKARAVLEPTRAKESMEKQVEESRERTVCDMTKAAKKHQVKWHDYIKTNEKELSRLRNRVIIAEKLAQNKPFIFQHPGLVSHITKSSMFSYSPPIPKPITSLRMKLDLRFGMLIGLSFMDSYKRLMKVIPEDVIQKVFCHKFRLGINDFAPFVAHLKHVDDNILPSAPVAPQKLFGFSDFNPDECVEMIITLLSLNEKVRSREDEMITHLIARNNLISLEIVKVIFSGGWILKSTFVSNAKIIKTLPDEYDYEWTRLKLGHKSINPRLCREAIGRRGKPFSELTIVVCSSNPHDSEVLKAGGAETVQVLLVDVQSAIETLFNAGKKKSSILIVYNTDKNGFKNLVNVASSAGVSLFSLKKVIKLTMKGWFDRFNPVFEQRHFFHPQDRVRK